MINTTSKNNSASRMGSTAETTGFYIVGGQQRSPRSLLENGQNWYDYRQGLVLFVDPVNGRVETRLEYVSPLTARAEQDPVLFKAGTIQGNTLYLCTQTEVLIYRIPEFEQIGYVSLPCFNDVHHVLPTPSATLLVANTGLEMVLEMTAEGEVLHYWNVMGEDPWEHFSPDVDYRKGMNLKPHRAHPNYLFYLDEEIWATRFEQKDAISLTCPSRRIAIGTERVHDGVLHGGDLYFTTVDGHLVCVDSQTLSRQKILNLNELHEGDVLLGWCRGLLLEDNKAWVGFSRVRPTKFREAVSWVRGGFQRSLPTHIACYDLAAQKCLAEIDLESYGLNAVFSILPVPAVRSPETQQQQ